MRTANQRLRVLLSAYACEPNRGSEPGVGWNWALQAARHHEVWVLTWSKFREAIEAERARRGYDLDNLHFIYYELPGWARIFARSERLHALLWQFGVLPLARRLHRAASFDVVHHVTFVSLEAGGLLWSLGPPFLWGPVGGGQVPPVALKAYFGVFWPLEVVRGLRKRLIGLNPLVRLAARRAACILVSNQDTRSRLEALGAEHLIDEVEIGIDLDPPTARRGNDGVLKVAWAGRFIPRKGPLLALDVASELARRGLDFQLRFAGDGPWEGRLRREIARRGLLERVTVIGHLAQAEMAVFYAMSDVFLFSSLQDTNGTVLLEAMAQGLPVVALDQHGAAAILTEDCGIKVAVESRGQVVTAMADALQGLADDREWLETLGAAARRRVETNYGWERKADLLQRLYTGMIREQPGVTAESSFAGVAE